MTGGFKGMGDLVSAVLCFSTEDNDCMSLQNAKWHQETASMEDALESVPPSLSPSVPPSLISSLSPSLPPSYSPLMFLYCSPSHPHCLPFLSPSLSPTGIQILPPFSSLPPLSPSSILSSSSPPFTLSSRLHQLISIPPWLGFAAALPGSFLAILMHVRIRTSFSHV